MCLSFLSNSSGSYLPSQCVKTAILQFQIYLPIKYLLFETSNQLIAIALFIEIFLLQLLIYVK